MVSGIHLFPVIHCHRLALGTHQNFVFCFVKIFQRYLAFVLTGSQQSGFVNQIGQIGPRETGRAAGHRGQINVFCQRNFFDVNLQNFFPPLNIRIGNRHLTVKTPRTQQSRIQNIGTVGRRNQNYALIIVKAVHLHQQLVQRLFALVIAAAQTGTAMAADRVNFIDKQQTGRIFFGLGKHIPHPRSTDTDKHLNKIRTGNRKKRNVSLTGHRFGQQGFTRTRRADHQHALRNTSAQPLKFAGIF